jgi:uncharacterized protein YbjT (DUF2867 family)
MIIITGATGKLGSLIVHKLLDRIPADQIGVSVRDPEKAQDLSARGVRVRHGDFNQPETLSKAFEGATQLLIISSNAQARGEDPIEQHRAAIEAAKKAGARRLLYTSHMGAIQTSKFPPMHTHAATEKMLADSGVAWTALRNGFYASSIMLFIGKALKSGIIEVPADGRVSWTTHADLAEATAAILAEEGCFDGPTPPLTGSEALDLSEVATIASDLLGYPVRRDMISDDEFETRMTKLGLPHGVIQISLSFYAASRNGEFNTTDPTLERLLGRKPDEVRAVIARNIEGLQ